MAKRTTSTEPDAPEIKMVQMEALQYHTYNGEAYEVGDTYDLPENLVDSVTLQGKAARTDRVEVARASRQAAEKSQAEREAPAKKGKRGRRARR